MLQPHAKARHATSDTPESLNVAGIDIQATQIWRTV